MTTNQETKKSTKINPDYLDHALRLAAHFQDSDMTHFAVEIEGLNVCFKREVKQPVMMQATPPVLTQTPPPAISQEKPVEDVVLGEVVKAPLVGTYYGSNAPGAKSFVEVGDHVKKGDVICIIEAMKVMNEIEAPCDGVIKEIKVANEAAVGFNEPLMIIG